MTAIDNLLDVLFDYAGLYPPASLDLPTVVHNYSKYAQSRNAHALRWLVVDLDRLDALREVAGGCFHRMKLTIVAQANADLDRLLRLLDEGVPIEAVEMKAATSAEVECIARRLPVGLAAYFEVPFDSGAGEMLDAICAAGARVKLRMGGVVDEAFPTPQATADILQAVAERHLGFKATAGLHHPLRSRHRFTYAPDSTVGMMHGFVNLCCAAALIHMGGDARDAACILEETDLHAWHIAPESIAWRDVRWSAEQMQEARQEFFWSIGSCSFTEPIADLEALGWL
jgi:hypothetical protein